MMKLENKPNVLIPERCQLFTFQQVNIHIIKYHLATICCIQRTQYMQQRTFTRS